VMSPLDPPLGMHAASKRRRIRLGRIVVGEKKDPHVKSRIEFQYLKSARACWRRILGSFPKSISASAWRALDSPPQSATKISG
jgi:hypothetical protein